LQLERPLVKVLDDSKYSSTLKLLEAFHNGDIKTYEDIMAKDGKAQVGTDYALISLMVMRSVPIFLFSPYSKLIKSSCR